MTQRKGDLPRHPLVGRDDALTSLVEVAGRARRDGGSALITGEAGLGKTALLQVVAEQLTDWTVVRVQADSFESDLSNSTVEAVVRAVNAHTGSTLHHPLPDDDPISVGRSLLDGIDALDRPLALLLDDAQWIDEPSDRALRFVFRRVEATAFLVIAASRPTQNGIVTLLSDTSDTSAHRVVIPLDPLTVGQTQALAQSILHHGISSRTATDLTEATQGSPLLVTMLLRQLGDSIVDAPHPAGWQMPDDSATPLTSAVSAALEGSSAATKAAAELVAVLRDPLPRPQLGTIATALGTRIDIDGAIARGLVHAIDRDGLAWLEPAHAMLADALAAQVPHVTRSGIHQVAADVLTGHRALRHRVEAADRSDAVLADELIVASRQAADLGRADQAMSYARSAVHLAANGAQRERCLLEAGLLAMRTRLHERIFDLRPQLEAASASLTRDTILIELRILTGDVPGAFALAVASLENTEDTPDARILRSRVAGALPKIQMATRDFAPVIDQIENAKRLLAAAPTDPNDIEDEALRWMVEPQEELLRLIGWQLTAAGHVGRGELLEAAIDELERLAWDAPDSSGLADALVTRARVFVLTGRLARARGDLDRANRLIRLFPMSWTSGFARTIYAHVLYLLGEWDESVSVADSAVSLALDETDLSGWPVALTVSTLVRAARGERAVVLERLEQAAQAAPSIAGSYDTDLPWIARAELARACRDPQAQLDAAVRGEQHAQPGTTMGWLTYRIDALAALGRADDATAALEQCEASETRWRPYYGSMTWLRARVAEVNGDVEQALKLYAQAVDEPQDTLLPHPVAVALLDGARLAAAQGRDDQATVWLQRASEIFSRLGAATYLNACQDALARLKSPAEYSDPLGALTTRERQVAHAVAAGMTNKEIAESFFVSVTTVNFHVRNILAKLEVSSRRDLRTLTSELHQPESRHAAAKRARNALPVKN